MRRFERPGIPGDFFEIRVDGPNLFVRLGPRGRETSERMRPQATPEAAAAEMQRLILAHLANDYAEVVPGPPVVTAPHPVRAARMDAIDRAEARRAEVAAKASIERAKQVMEQQALATIASEPTLEAECLASPDDPAPWAVYADWLQQRGDPRGEIAASLVGGQAQTANFMVGLHQLKLTGVQSPRIELTYRHGFAIGATIPNTRYSQDWRLGPVVASLAASPMGVFLERLICGVTDGDSYRPTLEAIIDSPLGQRLRVLRLDNFDYDDMMMHYAHMGDWSGLLEQFPVLEELRVRGDDVTYGTIDLPALRTFVRECCTMTDAELAHLGTARWPELDHLELWFGSEEYGVRPTVEAMQPIFAARGLPKLRHLGLVNSDAHAAWIPALARSKVLRQLESLDLSKGTIGAAEVPLLVEHAAAFRHLASIDLEENYLDRTDIEQLRHALDNLNVTNQRADEEEDSLRYVVEYE